jgi:hypothetical protein
MRVIFLDIDGVIATKYMYAYKVYKSKFVNRSNKIYSRKYSERVYENLLFSRKSIKALNKIVHHTDAKVVISSAWRYGKKVKYFQQLFWRNGFSGEIIGMTPKWNQYKNIIQGKDLEKFWSYERGNEILMWLNWNKPEIESFIIIDDVVEDILPLFLSDRIISTTIEKGLADEVHIKKAIFSLNNIKFSENELKVDV